MISGMWLASIIIAMKSVTVLETIGLLSPVQLFSNYATRLSQVLQGTAAKFYEQTYYTYILCITLSQGEPVWPRGKALGW